MSNNSSSSGGIGIVGALLILFVALKLCEVIDWSWWWVMSPLWGIAGVLLVGLAAVVAWAIAATLYEDHKKRQKTRR